ncbi:phage tail fiber protein [Paenibacillus graminis]|uniref:Uncharacterized protein n=1 Tax=Paenibacillus graminis TaxID=189425 RepID=A0A089M8G3_9BACL|nr:hypothetical protein [Paenibacillus graminis]AIQ69532.1 hypothetical protein PGRAT_19255 [Paenibacillus graminis]
MGVSNYLSTALLNMVFRNTAYTRPTTVYVALYTSNPTAADTGQEVTGGAYVRQSVAFAAPAAVGGVQTVKNSADIVFPIATANWGLVTHVGIRDAATGGNLLYFGELDNARTILTSDVFKFLASQLQATLS